MYWNRVWDWYARNIEKSIFITLIIMLLQIPHFVWSADLYLEMGLVSKVNPVLDFFLYGIDLVEVPLIVKTVVDFIILYKIKH